MASVIVPRPRLVERAAEALSGRSLVVVAPAGYGKTTLLEASLGAAGLRGAWVRATPSDRHGGRLLASIVAAVDAAAPGLSAAVADAGRDPRGAPSPTERARALMVDYGQLLVEPMAIVIDDAEVLHGSDDACSVLGELLRGTGPKVGVAILARRALPLRLAKLRETGRLVELGTGDLAFDADECSDLVAGAMGRGASVDEVDGLMTATEGWPLGIATLVRDGGVEVHPSGNDRALRSARALREYLREEVLASLEDAERTVLLSSAVPRRLTPAVARVLDFPERYLDAAGTQGLFLHRLGAAGEACAYHPLFREVLLDQLGEHLSDDEICAVHRRVAPVVAEHEPVEAIEHWIAAREWDAAIDAISARSSVLVSTSPALVRAWVERLPDHRRADARVQLLEGQVAWADGRYDAAIDHLRAGLDSHAEGEAVDRTAAPWARYLLIDCLTMVGRPDEGVAVARGGSGVDPVEARPASAAVGLWAAHGIAAAGHTAEALELAGQVEGLPDAGAAAPIDALMRAYIEIPAGDLAATAARTLTAYRQVEADDPLGLRFNLMAAHAVVLGEQGRNDEALAWWERHRVEADRALLAARSSTVRGLKAMLHAQVGRVAEAEDLLALHTATGTWADQSAHVARALVAASRADRRTALDAADDAVRAAQTAPPLFQWWTYADLVPALVAIGAFERAEADVDHAASIVDTTYPGPAGTHLRARTAVLRAYLAAERGESAEAAELVSTALDSAEQTAPDILRVEWSRIGPIVSDALARGLLVPERTIEWLWTAFPDGRALVELAEHPVAAVRRAAYRPALGSGNPSARAIVASATADDDPSVADAARDAVSRMRASPPPRRFETLGAFRVRVGGWTIDSGSWARPVDARLVRLLVTHGGSPVPTDLLLEALWPDLNVEGARRSLQVSASRARQILDHLGDGPSTIEGGRDTYRLRLGTDDLLDWQQFERAADVASDQATPSVALLERARSLWTGVPLPEERYADWAEGWSTRLVDRCAEVLVSLVGAYEREADHASAVRIARELVDLDPHDERSHRLLMAALARLGRRGQALHQYLVCRRQLVDDLGVEPSEQTSELYAAILAGQLLPPDRTR